MDSAEARHTASRSASAERFRRPATRSHLWNLPTNTLHNTCAWPGHSAGNALCGFHAAGTNFGRRGNDSSNQGVWREQEFAARGKHRGNERIRRGNERPFESRSYGGEAGIRTLGRTLKALQRFSKPPPSASRPPHRARKLSIRQGSTYAERIVPIVVPEIVPASSQNRRGTATLHASGALIRMQRFFSPTTMPATDWRTPLYSHEPASTSLAKSRVEDTRGAQI